VFSIAKDETGKRVSPEGWKSEKKIKAKKERMNERKAEDRNRRRPFYSCRI
jgi:hypothetical protein